ncbi:MAG: AfsR/SARP family transcriptional regulator [Ilumatobacteraceae bacterium]
MARIDVSVLGRPHVVVDGVSVPLGGRQLLLAVRLAVAHPVAVSTHRLLDDVWPPGAASPGAVRVALTRLRGALGPHAVMRIEGNYALSPGTRVDAAHFEQLLRNAHDRSRLRDARISTLDEALAIWRGPAYDDLERFAWVDAEAVRLDELREQAIDLRFELRLVDHDPASLVSELRAALDCQPTRERRAEMLALTLYRSGRQSDALDVVTRVRDTLRNRLGLNLSPALAELEVRILRHDPDLLAVARRRRPDDGTLSDARLRAATALIRTGVYEEAFTILDDTLAESRAVGDRRTAVLALLARAQALSQSGDGDPNPAIDDAQAIGRSMRDGDLLARAALVRAGLGTPEDKTAALIELTAPLELLAADAPQRVDLLCAAAVIVTFIDASPAAERLLAAAETAHEATRSLRSEALVLGSRSILAAVRGAGVTTVHAWARKSYETARRSGDPFVLAASLQALLRSEYTLGNLAAVDDLLPVLQEAADAALLPFAAVRVSLSRTTNAIARGALDEVEALIAATSSDGRRYRTFNTERATTLQMLLLMFERDERRALADIVRARAEAFGPGAWHAILALCEPDRDAFSLIDLAPRVPLDDSFWPWVAFAAEAGARRGDAAIGAWCADRLDALGDCTITVGLGTVVMGFAAHYAGLARVASGELDAARCRFDRAIALASGNGAELWRAHSTVELAEVLARSGDPATVAEAQRLLDELSVSPIVRASNRLARRVDEVTRSVAVS